MRRFVFFISAWCVVFVSVAGVASAGVMPGGWVKTSAPAGYEIWTAAVADSSTAVIFGVTPSHGTHNYGVFRTTDRGATWTTVRAWDSTTPAWIDHLAFATPTLGWADGSALLRTTDGGATWDEMPITLARDERISAAALGQSAWCVAWRTGTPMATATSTMYVSHDGGTTWASHDILSMLPAVNRMAFGDDQVGLATAANHIYRTIDGGVTWSLAPDVTSHNLRGLCFSSPSVAWVVGEDGTVMRSADAGLTWVKKAADMRGILFYDVAASPDGKHVWAVGEAQKTGVYGQVLVSGVAIESDDDGSSWTLNWSGDDASLRAVAVTPDCSFGIAVGLGADSVGSPRLKAEGRDVHAASAEVITYLPDTKKPTTKAPSAARAVRGRSATLKLSVSDPRPSCGFANVIIKIKSLSGAVKQTLKLAKQPMDQPLKARFACRLPVGGYRFFVYATDLAGHKQARVGSNSLVVR